MTRKNQKKGNQIKYEVWSKEGEMCFSTAESFKGKNSQMIEGMELIHTFFAETGEEASSIYNLRVGFGPYKPMGEPELCPKCNVSYYYPKGSGECPYCGKIC